MSEAVPEKGTGQTAASCTVTLPVLREGHTGGSVRALQRLLIGAGHSVGPDGADGDFGSNTKQALIACQKGKGLDADGVAGKASWTALLS